MNQNKQQLPNATATLVLGILSIVLCWTWGIIGIVLAIIALVISKKSVVLYNQSPDMYLGYGNLKAGRIMSIIGLVLSAIYLLYAIIVIAFMGTALFSIGNILQGIH
ncbi:MAG: hypothetical protein JXB34_12545 [Bacteroidales bacterium]|nr:hypothetical protein [Bacteroidales bacterium]